MPDLYYNKRITMQYAINEAKKCIKDVPIGCVIKKDGQIIASAHNRRELDDDVTAHAEILAIKEAQKVLNTSRLKGCELYVTLEPCPMCTGAIINSRIPKLVFGARDAVTGSCGSVIDLFCENYGHRPAVFPGVLQEDSAKLLREFFKTKR